MSAAAQRDGSGDPDPRTIVVSCRVCRASEPVATRWEFTRFEETHARDCALTCVAIGGSLEDILDLPPY